MPARISVDSTEYIRVPVSAEDNGVPINPMSPMLAVELAVLAPTKADPDEPDWVTGSWEQDAEGQFYARVLVGPSAVPAPFPLARGEYKVWVRIHDNPEVPVRDAGRLIVY